MTVSFRPIRIDIVRPYLKHKKQTKQHQKQTNKRKEAKKKGHCIAAEAARGRVEEQPGVLRVRV